MFKRVVIMLLSADMIACGGNAAPLVQGVPAATGSPPGSVPIVTSPTPQPIVFTNENWALAVSDANRYKGSTRSMAFLVVLGVVALLVTAVASPVTAGVIPKGVESARDAVVAR
jgi:hypothetical protein